MFDPDNVDQLNERLDALREYAADITDLEARAAALKDLRDVVIAGLTESGVLSRAVAKAAGISHVRVATIVKQANSAA